MPGKNDTSSAPEGGATLTTEDARGLAQRWAFWHVGLKQCADNAEFDAEMAKAPMLLDPTERERLFAWVRTQCQDIRDRNTKAHTDHNVGPVSPEFRRDIAATLEGRLSEGPDRKTGDPMFGFENAWGLCEAAGWPNG